MRLQSVDQFRVFAIISMILVNFLAYFDATPAILKHAERTGLTFTDLVAPFFLFMIGLVSFRSLSRSIQKNGKLKAYLKAIRRNCLLIVIGVLGGALAKAQLGFSWGILQAIGLAGLIALPFCESRAIPKVFLCVGVCVFYWLLGATIPDVIAQGKHGGPQGAFMWSLCILFGEIAASLVVLDGKSFALRTTF